MVRPLVHIFNLLLEKSIWFSAFKNTLTVNYRSFISKGTKICEKLMYNRLHSFTNVCNIISNIEYVFAPGEGTRDTPVIIAHDTYQCVTDSKCVLATVLNLAKHYDTVNDKIITEKLSNYNFRFI